MSENRCAKIAKLVALRGMTNRRVEQLNTRGKFVIAGGGPVGAMLAITLGRRDYAVDLYEARPDSRSTSIYQGKSINIALSDRGWRALDAIGIADEVRSDAIEMPKRVMHAKDGTLTEQPYGRAGDAIWSVSRLSEGRSLSTARSTTRSGSPA